MRMGVCAALTAIATTACMVLCGCGTSDIEADGINAALPIETDGINAALPEDRFKHGPIGWSDFRLVVDTHTGVTYLFYHGGNKAGLTPLLNSDGTPVIDDRYPVTEEVDE